jgi:hypothetical protein
MFRVYPQNHLTILVIDGDPAFLLTEAELALVLSRLTPPQTDPDPENPEETTGC